MLALQPASPVDLQALLTWFPALADLIQWGGPNLRFPLDAAQLDDMLAESRTNPPRRRLWSGFLPSGELVAHAQAVIDCSRKTARLARIATSPARRGDGLAKPFLQQVLQQLETEADITELELNVFTFNLPALRLYKSLGFKDGAVPARTIVVAGETWDVIRLIRPAHVQPTH